MRPRFSILILQTRSRLGWPHKVQDEEMLQRLPRVYVVHPYLPAGGTLMAYHLARILQLDFDLEVVAVGDEMADHGVFDYDIIFPSVSIAAMRREIAACDVLIANPSFSHYGFGFDCPGRKIMYVQGFNSFRLLDCRFDLYVAVSGFVQRFLSEVYEIEAEVIHPFIRANALPAAPAWQMRREGSVLVSLKGGLGASLECLRHLVPEINLNDVLVGKMPWRSVMERIGQARIFLSLAPSEGFGLMPLEAMALGCTVAGFDGFGSRDYLRPGINCAATAYANVERLADQLRALLADPDNAAILAEAGRATASVRQYTYQAFRENWCAVFKRFLTDNIR
jgi:glycosyltransferase involved in cell wall biosynthesis